MSLLALGNLPSAPRMFQIPVSSAGVALPQRLRVSPFTQGQKVIESSAGAAVGYRAYAPWGDKTRHLFLKVPPTAGVVGTDLVAFADAGGSRTVTIALAALAASLGFVGVTARANAALTAALAMEAIVLVNGVPVKRVGSDTAAADGQWWNDAGTPTQLKIRDNLTTALLGPTVGYNGTTPVKSGLGLGAQIEVLVPSAIVTDSALTANVPVEMEVREFMNAGVAAINLMGFAGR